jgi:hypothetical protein
VQPEKEGVSVFAVVFSYFQTWVPWKFLVMKNSPSLMF